MTENREIKSGVFADLFCDDEKDGKKNFLSLYNALHGTDLKLEETTLERQRIPQSLYKTFYNDISVVVNGKLIVLVEHQSTPNENMPLRFLEYYVHLLYGIVPADARYKKNRCKIPAPEFFVFYNGDEKQEGERILRLSDAFVERQDEPACEVVVKFSNIGGTVGENLRVVKNCDILKQYCDFMEIIARHRALMKKNPTGADARGCYEQAISEAISKNILADYLSRKSTEVKNMFIGEYDYDTDVRVQREEAAEQRAINSAKNLLAMNVLTPEQIAQALNLPIEQVLQLQKEAQASVTA